VPGYLRGEMKMAVSKPFKRTARPQADSGKYLDQGHYIKHAQYAVAPAHYIRAFQILQKDLIELFDYVEPADKNKECYSYRIHELHTRACIEVEANCKLDRRGLGGSSGHHEMCRGLSPDFGVAPLSLRVGSSFKFPAAGGWRGAVQSG
jgi:hypothetical protein